MHVTWPAANVIRFNFNSIYLPDSSTNLMGSMGHVIYSVSPVAGIAIGTEITNSAAIYFDYNQPVITNNTLNTIASPSTVTEEKDLSGKFYVYPNPVITDLNISVSDPEGNYIEIINMTGEIIKSIPELKNVETVVNLKEFGPGIYLVRLLDKTHKPIDVKKVTVQ
jgi:hypothetical protein